MRAPSHRRSLSSAVTGAKSGPTGVRPLAPLGQGARAPRCRQGGVGPANPSSRHPCNRPPCYRHPCSEIQPPPCLPGSGGGPNRLPCRRLGLTPCGPTTSEGRGEPDPGWGLIGLLLFFTSIRIGLRVLAGHTCRSVQIRVERGCSHPPCRFGRVRASSSLLWVPLALASCPGLDLPQRVAYKAVVHFGGHPYRIYSDPPLVL